MLLKTIKKWCKERKRKRIEAELSKTIGNPDRVNDLMNRIVDPLLDNRKIGSTKTKNRKNSMR